MAKLKVFNQIPLKFRKCRVVKAHAGEERNYTPGETVLWPGDVRLPDWLEVIAILSDDPRSVPVHGNASTQGVA